MFRTFLEVDPFQIPQMRLNLNGGRTSLTPKLPRYKKEKINPPKPKLQTVVCYQQVLPVKNQGERACFVMSARVKAAAVRWQVRAGC